MGTLYVVATPIGNLSDITKRALETLENVDLILCEDTRHSLKLLNHFNIKKKLVAYHKFNERKKCDEITDMLKSGINIALITDAGTPCISDPGYVLIKNVKEYGISVIGVGGISAIITALSVSGLNTDSFSFYGFFPRESKDREKLIKIIKKGYTNLAVIYESPKRIVDTLKYLYGKIGDVMVSISCDLTKIHEANYYGLLSDVIERLDYFDKSDLGEYTIILEVLRKEDEEIIKYSIEALLVDIVVKNNVSMKEAIDILNKNSNYSKKDIYNASLNLKKL